MSDFIISEKQFKRLIETGSNSAAMDLDIYVQPVERDTSDGNENIIDSLESIKNKVDELKNMFETGKKIKYSTRNEIHKLLDDFNDLYESIIVQN